MRDILAFADNYRTWGSSVRYAGELAALVDGQIAGLFVAEPVVPFSPSPLPVLPPEVYTVSAEMVREAAAAEAAFKKFIAQTGAKQSRWIIGQGFFAATLANAATWHDVLIVSSGDGSPWGSVGYLGQLLLSCDLPCIVVPESFAKKTALDTISIAWNGSSEAVRAMHAAMPLIRRAKRVLLLIGEQKPLFSAVNIQPPFAPEDYLRGHDVRFETKPFEAVPADAGAQLLRAAEENHADLLVMGAFGRSRLSEWVLGGATRHVLQHASMPIFMRH